MICSINNNTIVNMYRALWHTSHHSKFLHILTHLFLKTLWCKCYVVSIKSKRNLEWMVSHSNLNSLYKSNIISLTQALILQGSLCPLVAHLAGQTQDYWEAAQVSTVLVTLDFSFSGKSFDCPMSIHVPQYFF